MITEELAKLNIDSVFHKIRSLRKKCLLPIPVIAAAHIFYLYSENFQVFQEMFAVFAVSVGSILMIGMANIAKGRKVMPDIKFRDTNPFD